MARLGGRNIQYSRTSQWLTLIMGAALTLAACGGSSSSSSSGNGENGSDPEAPALPLSTESSFGKVTLEWEGDEPADVMLSSDPDCDWGNYSTCPDSELLTDQDSGVVLTPQEHELEYDRNVFFTIEQEDERSPVKGAAPWAPGQNRSVLAMMEHDGRLFVGGGFSHVGPNSGNGAILDNDGRLQGALQKVEGTVRAAIADGEGGWYIGGNFDRVGGEPRERLAHIRANGALDEDWNPGADGSVRTLALAGDRLYVGGTFDQIADDNNQDYLAALDAETGALEDWDPDVSHPVHALEVADGTLYAGGEFYSLDGTDGRHLAAFDASSGDLLSWGATLDHTDQARTLTVHGDTVYVGGDIGAAGDEPENRENLAAFDANSGELLDWAPETNNPVNALVVDNGVVYAGGEFTQAEDETRSYLAAFDSDEGSLENWEADVDDDVQALKVVNGALHVAGDFTAAGEEDADRLRLAAFDTDEGELLDWHPGAASDGGFTGQAHVITYDGERFYAGGDFRSIGGPKRPALAVFDAETGQLEDWDAGIEGGFVRAFEASGDTIYAGGNFELANEDGIRGIASFEREDAELNWSKGLDQAAGATPRTLAIAIDDQDVYIGGRFTDVEDTERMNVALLDHSDGAVDQQWDPEVGGTGNTVYAMEILGDTLYVGGDIFSVTGGDPGAEDERVYNLAALALDEQGTQREWNPDANNNVYTMTTHDGDLYVGGRFFEVRGGDDEEFEDQSSAAVFDTSAEANLLDWDPQVQGGRIEGMTQLGDSLYLGGTFDELGEEEEERWRAGAVNADDAGLLDWNPDVNGAVWTLASSDSTVYVAGDFSKAGGDLRAGIIALDHDEEAEFLW